MRIVNIMILLAVSSAFFLIVQPESMAGKKEKQENKKDNSTNNNQNTNATNDNQNTNTTNNNQNAKPASEPEEGPVSWKGILEIRKDINGVSSATFTNDADLVAYDILIDEDSKAILSGLQPNTNTKYEVEGILGKDNKGKPILRLTKCAEAAGVQANPPPKAGKDIPPSPTH